jgi:hypothetical protein
MGHYHKKPYKKHPNIPYIQTDIKQEYLNAINKQNDDEVLDNPYLNEFDNMNMIDDPEIVQQLRREELEGTLPLFPVSFYEETSDFINNYNQDKNNTSPKKNTNPIPTYKETLQIAKKALQTISPKNKRSIQFLKKQK